MCTKLNKRKALLSRNSSSCLHQLCQDCPFTEQNPLKDVMNSVFTLNLIQISHPLFHLIYHPPKIQHLLSNSFYTRNRVLIERNTCLLAPEGQEISDVMSTLLFILSKGAASKRSLLSSLWKEINTGVCYKYASMSAFEAVDFFQT